MTRREFFAVTIIAFVGGYEVLTGTVRRQRIIRGMKLDKVAGEGLSFLCDCCGRRLGVNEHTGARPAQRNVTYEGEEICPDEDLWLCWRCRRLRPDFVILASWVMMRTGKPSPLLELWYEQSRDPIDPITYPDLIGAEPREDGPCLQTKIIVPVSASA